MASSDPDTGPLAGLAGSLKRTLSTLLAIAQTRLQLVSTELREEIGRAVELLAWGFVALFSAGIGLFLGALVVIFAFWETHRVVVSILMVGFFFLLAGTAALVVVAKLKDRPPPFDTTLTEFTRDIEGLEPRHIPRE